ncbi:MAG: hypothetical protein RL381_43 [Actinomycetota bacterium]
MKIRATFSIVITVATTILITPNTADAHSKNEISINVVGDVHGERAIKRSALSSLKKDLAGADLNIFNLETAVTAHDEKVEKAYNFTTDLAFLKSLRGIGFNVATVANNHSFDFGPQGFSDTLVNLKRADISYVGGGANSKDAYRGRIYTIKGKRIGVLGIAKVNGGPDSIALNNRAGITNGYDAQSTESAITRIKAASDFVIVLAHWGEEGSFCPRNYEKSSATKWLSLGADVIVGAHTHTLQPVSFAHNKLVAYSMGNFIFYSSKIENRTTGILRLRISQTGRIQYEIEPYVINNLTKVPEKSSKDNGAMTNNKDSVLGVQLNCAS